MERCEQKCFWKSKNVCLSKKILSVKIIDATPNKGGPFGSGVGIVTEA